jgi:catechol 2,3-dioxygenase-like lactoylglutathione lyase family enzyme
MLSRKQFIARFLGGLAAGVGYPSSALSGDATPATSPIVGIDHIPLAVKDLERAAETYRRLGFAIKPGRLHADGIRNSHVKFEDGAGIELITAPAATDALMARYVQLLSQGEGPAYVSFHAESLLAVQDGLAHLGHAYSVDNGFLEITSAALQWLFIFEGNNRSPTDRPEHFAHPNTANATLAVWIAGGDEQQVLAVFAALGARIGQKTVYAPDPVLATVATVANGEIVFLPSERQVTRGRPIVGVVFRTRDLSALQHALRSADVHHPVSLDTATYRSVFIAPQDTHGVWLEFRELR